MKNTRKSLQLEILENRVLLAVSAGGASAELPVNFTSGAVWIVNTVDDPAEWNTGDAVVSLREAVSRASEGDTICFDSSLSYETINLSGTEIRITKGITIDAGSIEQVSINAGAKSRIFSVALTDNVSSVTLKSLALSGGNAELGGGIFLETGFLELNGCAVSNCTAKNGGALANLSGTLTLTQSDLMFNTAAENGGAVINSGRLNFDYCTVGSNTALADGGGLYTANSEVTAAHTNFSSNSAVRGGSILAAGGGLSFSDSSITLSSASENGAGIFAEKSAVTLLKTDFSFNQAGKGGGGIYTLESDFTLEGCVLSQNTAADGAALYKEAGSICVIQSNITMNTADNDGAVYDYLGESTFEETYFTGNEAAFGGGIYAAESNPLVITCVFERNSALYGGGIYNNASSLDMLGCYFDNNTAYDGAGLYSDGYTFLEQSHFSENAASFDGGAVYISDGILSASECTFTSNSAELGGGLFFDTVEEENPGNFSKLVNCTISANTAFSTDESTDPSGGGIYNKAELCIIGSLLSKNRSYGNGGGICNNGYIQMVCCTVAQNTADTDGGGCCCAEFSCIEFMNSILLFNSAQNSGTDIYNTGGNTSAYNTISEYADWTSGDSSYLYDSSLPLFTDAANGDFTLAENSQAIDYGDNDYDLPDTDLNGNPRVVNEIADLGAYEYQGETPVRPAAPSILTGTGTNWVSNGGNRHKIAWTSVNGADGYELAYAAEGDTWSIISSEKTSAVITGLNYGSSVRYRVRTVSAGVKSEWSSISEFNVCPMDINNDGDIAGPDRSFLIKCWLSSEGDDGFIYACDINGDGDIAGPDRSYLAANWLLDVDDENLVYPVSAAADAAIAEFVSEFDVDLSMF